MKISKFVKEKKIQSFGGTNGVIIPKMWMEMMGWNLETKVVLEVLPYSKKIIVHELSTPELIPIDDEETSDTNTETDNLRVLDSETNI